MRDICSKMRKKVINTYNEKGIEFLQKEVESIDPIFYNEVDKKNPQRLMRSIRNNLFNKQNIFKFQNKNL